MYLKTLTSHHIILYCFHHSRVCLIISYICYTNLFILYKPPIFQLFYLNNGWLRLIAAWAVPVTNFKENFVFDLANPIENYSVFFNLSRVMTLSLEKDK